MQRRRYAHQVVTEQRVAELPEVDLRPQSMLLTFYGDYVSLYLAALNGVDPENIDSINILNHVLAKLQIA